MDTSEQLKLLQGKLDEIATRLFPQVEILADLVLMELLADGKGYSLTLDELEALVVEAYTEGWHLMSAFQKEVLGLDTQIDEMLDAFAVNAAETQGALVKDSMLVHVKNVVAAAVTSATTAAVAVATSYITLTVTETITGAGKNAADTVGTIFPSTHKQFARVRDVAEPRSDHTVLEEKIIGVDEYWNLGGFLVLAPRDPSLPASQRFGCQHTNIYMALAPDDPRMELVGKGVGCTAAFAKAHNDGILAERANVLHKIRQQQSTWS